MTANTFLDLPGEIRNQIYHELLVLETISTDHPIYPEILHTCHKIHGEARQILYGCNTFIAHSNLLSGMPRLRKSFSTFSSHRLISMIRRYKIHVRLDCDPNFSAKKAEEAFSGVEELTVEVFQAQFASSENHVLRLFENIRGVKKARIYGSITEFLDYTKWLELSMMAKEGSQACEFGQQAAVEARGYDAWTVSSGLT